VFGGFGVMLLIPTILTVNPCCHHGFFLPWPRFCYAAFFHDCECFAVGFVYERVCWRR